MTPLVDPAPPDRIEFREIPWAIYYRFGSDGSVWSRRCRGRWGHISDSWHRLRPTPSTEGRPVVKLGLGGKSRLYYVHKLICEAFYGPRPPGMECCHFPDRDPANCRADNLRWDTSKANKADMLIHGTRAKGSRNGRSKLKESDIPAIRSMLANGATKSVIARKYSVDRKTIQLIEDGRNWRHII